VAGVLALLAAACDSGDGHEAAGDFTPAHPGVLTVATRPIPTAGFWDGASGAPTGGFEYELSQLMAERFGLTLQIVQRPFADLVAGELGGADMALAQISPTSGREHDLDFSIGYLDAGAGMLVHAGTDISDLAAARDLRWAVQWMTTNEDFLHDIVRPHHDPAITATRADAIRLLETNEVDAVLLDTPVAVALADRSDGRLAVPAQIATDGVEAVALPNGSSNKEAVDSALRALLADGTIDDLAERWLGVGTDGTVTDVPVLRTES
jgi:ABC-type amino acid transport substrate-binding protein